MFHLILVNVDLLSLFIVCMDIFLLLVVLSLVIFKVRPSFYAVQ